MMDMKTYQQHMTEKGWVIFHDFFSKQLVQHMLADLDEALTRCHAIQVKNGIAEITGGTVHHLIGQGKSFLTCLSEMEPLIPFFEDYFKGKCIVNSFGGNVNVRNRISYANNIHRDIRTYSGDLPLVLNTLVMLDDFTVDNGATYLMSGSHKTYPEKPSEDVFFKSAERAVAGVGSLLVFNSNVWHAAAENYTDLPRRSVTPMFSKPFIKQQFDYPRCVGYENQSTLTPHLQQLLGFNARVPATLDEWYQPPEKRMYRSDQG